MDTLKLVYLETCLPGYFQGFGGQVYAVPLTARPRTGEVLQGLLDCIDGEELFVDGQSVDESVYDELKKQAHELFSDSDRRKAWLPSCDDASESYAYFGVQQAEE